MNSKNENSAMLCDFYEFTMGNGYLKNNLHKKNVYFDVFFRNIPDDGGFASSWLTTSNRIYKRFTF